MRRSLRVGPVFLCAPQIVSSWLYYPAWLSIPGVIPDKVIVDSEDFNHYRTEADSLNATPYSVLTWDTLDLYQEHRFVTADTSYLSLVRAKLPEIREIADKVTRSLSREQLQQITVHSYESWKKYGLEIRRRWKGKDTIFSSAIIDTVAAMEQARKGNLPIDPEKLVRRHLLKLLVGLLARNRLAEVRGILEKNILVFDIPEFQPAADLLVKKLGMNESPFVIPTVSPNANERIIVEALRLDDSDIPLWGTDIDLFHDACEEIDDLIKKGHRGHVIEEEIESELNKAREKIQRTKLKSSIRATFGSALGFGNAVTAGLLDASSVAVVSALGTLGFLMDLVATREKVLRDELSRYSPSVQFLASREFVYPTGVRPSKARMWKARLFGMARTVLPRSLTHQHIKEEISRQLIGPWIDNPVWYDP